MTTGRVMVYEKGVISSISKKCFSCEYYDCDREITGYEKFCGGIVIRVRCSDEAECRKRGKPVGKDSRCSSWRAYPELMNLIEKVM